MPYFKLSLLPVVAIFGIVCAAAQAKEITPTEKLIERQGKLCFARVYDAAHLKAHPRQRVERVFFLIGKGKAASYWEDPNLRHSEESPNKHANPAADDPERDTTRVVALVTLRGARKPEYVAGWCSSEAHLDSQSKKLSCGGECDHHIGAIYSDEAAHLMLEDVEQAVLLDSEAEEAGDKSRLLGPDDKKFRLDARPLSDCVAEANKTNPRYAGLGAPLRERLKPDAPFCYGRDYSTQHLTSHPQQLTNSIRVSRDDGQIAVDRAKGLLVDWPDGVGLSISVTTRKQPKPVRLHYVCTPLEDQWECSASFCKSGMANCSEAERENAKATACDKDDSRTVYLRRGQAEFVMLGNPIAGLPLDGSCAQKDKTASDDKVYRLDSMPLAACESPD
ncbi:hypothetical protein [Methylocystis sp. ATCC 49242]|uniref:hypothetical protein n=1 Tax=Methylocystis sp. ATCC 49242 TaxID=622637 RepID=UPI0001F879E5|nr:hypothetical protein [Methylocystis sp. ATCC 49242]